MGFRRSKLGSLVFGLGSTLFILISFTVEGNESRAHHKVHNLALYPERHSWCQATKIRQEIAHAPECHTKTIDNVVCLGACFSYSVPRAQDDPVIPPYCDACRPTEKSWKVVTLNCTKPITGEPYQLARNVEIISNCSCVDCNDNKPRKGSDHGEESNEDDLNGSRELPDSLFNRRRTNEVDNNEVDGHDDDENDNNNNVEGGIGDGDEDDDDGGEEEEEELKPLVPDSLPKPTLHKLKSVSAELREFHRNTALDEELMIKDNKIPSDDDHDQESARNNMITKERQRAQAERLDQL